ncbi:MAG: terminase small subunit [Lachnospiraceae bacterium]|nr:terminase small subunit [Lachnospiraceae bacterium]
MALTKKQKLFVDEYLIDLNATRAYRMAYPRVKSAEVAKAAGSRLLTNVNVAEYVKERMKDREHRTEITQDWVLEELRKIASINGTDFAQVVREPIIRNNSYVVDPGAGQVRTMDVVRITPTAELPEEKRAAISSIKETKFGINVETYDRIRALELIGRHLGMFRDKVELTGKVKTDNPYAGLTTEELKKLIHGG